jgi:hypothetical protein
MWTRMRSGLLLFSAISVCVGLTLTTVTGGAPVAQLRTLYVSVTDAAGLPLKDLSAADFEVKEGGEPRAITEVKLTTKPIRMAILIADGGSGAFLQALAALLQKLQGTTEMSLISVIDQPERMVDYTNDVEKLVEGVQRLNARPIRQMSGHLMEGIDENIKTLPKAGFRPVLVVMRTATSAASPIGADVVREAIRRTGTRLYVLGPPGSSGRTEGGLEVVLNEGAKESGGRYEEIGADTLLQAAAQIADELNAQYELSYTVPDGVVVAADRLEVTSKRQNAKVQAPTRIPN